MGYVTFHAAVLLIILFLATISTAQNFKCNSNSTCTALVGYVSPNETSIAEIQSLFSIKNRRRILGANNLPLSTSRHYKIQAQQIIRIPIPCRCTNNTGVSINMPVYKIKKDDGLYHIAVDVFSGLVQYERIQEFNNISNPNVIKEGEYLIIPLPCSCDDVKGEKVVHYAHIVKSGSTFDSIAEMFGTDKETLMELNDIDDETKLIADTTIDVPLKACKSSIESDSLDSGLNVANGTYVFTANDCVKCKCDAADNWILQCEPSQLQSSKWGTCPSMQCEESNSLFIGNTTSTACNQSTCSYAGYSSESIITTLETKDNCPTPNEPPPPTNTASRISWGWSFLSSSVHLGLIYLHLFK